LPKKDVTMSAPPDLPEPASKFRIEVAPSTLVAIALMVASIVMLIHLVPVILTLITALMLVGTLNPAVVWLEQRKVHRVAAISIVFLVLLLILVALAVFTLPEFAAQVASLVEREPQLRARLVKFLAGYPLTASLAVSLGKVHYAALLNSYSAEALAISKSLVEIVAYGAGAFFLAFYIMLDRDRLRGALFAAIPRAHHIKLSRILLKLQTIVGGYMRGQVITCVLMAVVVFVVLAACDVPNAIAIAAFSALVDVLPFINIFLIMIPAVLAAYAVSPVTALVVFIVLLVYCEFESRVLIPVVYGRSLRLPSSIVLFALIAGGTLYGVAGALLALPVAAAILMLVEELNVDLPGETAQADDIEVQKQDSKGEAEYLRRTDGMSAKDAAGIALEITEDRNSQEQDDANGGKPD
jgi:predicted PurR-regulated permease PerM